MISGQDGRTRASNFCIQQGGKENEEILRAAISDENSVTSGWQVGLEEKNFEADCVGIM